jgi:hypothetical protein
MLALRHSRPLHAELSETVLQLIKIVSDSMANVKWRRFLPVITPKNGERAGRLTSPHDPWDRRYHRPSDSRAEELAMGVGDQAAERIGTVGAAEAH